MNTVAAPSATPVNGPVLNCRTDVSTLTVGEVKYLICDAMGIPPQSKVEFINADPKPYEIQFLGAPQFSAGKLTQNFTSYKVGPHNFTQLQAKVDDHVVPVSSQSFDVKSIIEAGEAPPPGAPGQPPGQAQAPTPFPIQGLEEVGVPAWWWIMWGSLFFVILAAALWRLVKFLKSREKKSKLVAEKELTPREKFQMKMRKLESRGLHLRGEYKAFALELTSILKTTIGENLHFPAEDLTSEELLSTLERRHRAFFNTAGLTLTQFLADLDQIKFAKVETTAQKCQDLLDQAARIGNAVFGAIT